MLAVRAGFLKKPALIYLFRTRSDAHGDRHTTCSVWYELRSIGFKAGASLSRAAANPRPSARPVFVGAHGDRRSSRSVYTRRSRFLAERVLCGPRRTRCQTPCASYRKIRKRLVDFCADEKVFEVFTLFSGGVQFEHAIITAHECKHRILIKHCDHAVGV